MAEKPGELNDIDKLDPIAVREGAGAEVYKYADDYESTGADAPAVSSAAADEVITNVGDNPEETLKIRAQIEETRREMGETIDAIQERLSLSNISEQVSEQVNNAVETAKDTVYDATIGKMRDFMKRTGDGIANSGIVRTVSDNPFPLLLIGLGAGLLAYQSYSGGSRKSYRRSRGYMGGSPENWARRDDPNMRSMRKTGGSAASGLAAGAGGAYEQASGAAREAADRVSGTARDTIDRVSSTASETYRSAGETLNSAYSGAADLANRAYERAGEYGNRAYETYDYYIEENPLVVGAVAAALGAAVGFAIPASRFEGRMMGEARDQVIGRFGDVANEFVERARHVADEAGQTIKEKAREAASETGKKLKDEGNRALNA